MMLPNLNLRLAQFSASTPKTRTSKSLAFVTSSSSTSSPLTSLSLSSLTSSSQSTRTFTCTSTTRTTSSSSSLPSPSSSSLSSSSSPSPTPLSSLYNSRTTRLSSCLTYPLVLLSLLLLLVLHPASVCNAERDFNFNDSQVPLLEPKDEPILIEGHHHQHQHQHNDADAADIAAYNQLHHHHQHHQDPYAMELSHCRYGDNELVLSLVLKNYNWHDVSETRSEKVLEKLSKFFAIPKEFIKMESVTKHELSQMQKESLKKGNNKCHTNIMNNRKLGRVNFIIGCRSSYFKIAEPIVKQIGQQVKDGAIDNITGEKFGWWVIWRKHYKTRAMRSRRQIEGSGTNDNDDYEDENENDDYEYDDDEEVIDQHTNKQTSSTPSKTETSSSSSNANNNSPDPNEDESDLLNSNALERITHAETLKSHGRDDITALKQTDAETNLEEEQKPRSNLLLLNKKGLIDEEIVESVSELESVITKTIENTKNIEEIPVRNVDQPEDVLLKQVLHQPTQTLEETENIKNSDRLNLNSNYETPNEDDLNNNKKEDIPTTTTHHTVTISTTTLNTTPHVNKDNHFDNSLNHNHLRHHGNSENMEAHQSPAHHVPSSPDIDFASSSTTTISLLPPPPPIILTDSTTLTLTTPNENSAVDSLSSASSSSSSSTSSSSSFSLSSSLPASVSGSVVTTAVTSTANTSSSATLPSTTTSATTSHKKIPYTSNKMIKVDINKYDDEKDDDEDDDDIGTEEIDIDDNMVLNGKYQGISTTLTPTTLPHQQLPPAFGSASASTLRHAVTTTPATPQPAAAAEESIVEHSKHNGDKHGPPTQGTAYHHYYDFAASSSSSSLHNSETTVLPYEQEPTPSVTTTIAATISDEELLKSFANSGKKEYYDNTFDTDDDQDVTSSKVSSSTTQQSAADESTTTLPASTHPATTTQSSSSSPGTSTSTTQELPTTATPTPDYIEPKTENTPPMIRARLQKLAVTSGKQFKFIVPEDTFFDSEDMSNLRLELSDKEGRELKTNSWLQFNAETKEIYGLPLDDAVSKWQYRLTATDSGNESVTETLEIAVQQHRGVRTVNHEINIAVKINEKNMHFIDWQMKLINGIATTLGDDSTNSIVIREIRQNTLDPAAATLVYFNETLPTSECPENELNSLVKRLDANRLSELVQPSLGIKSITGQLIGSCQKTVTAKPKPTVTKNASPVVRNQVDSILATAGHLLVFKVPADTFFDNNDSKLKLSVKTKDMRDLSPRHWLQFDSKNDEFYGIPKSGAAQSSEEYLLIAEDAGGLTATDALVVTINPAPKREFSVLFKAQLGIRHEQFTADLQRKFVERIAQLFGDSSTDNIQIRSINTMHDMEGTTVNFYNTTLYKTHQRCPEEEVEAARSVYMQDNMLRDKVKRLLGAELNITNILVHAYGCIAQSDIMRPDFIPNKTEEPLFKSTFPDDYLYTIILPAIIIVTMILVASIIACCLHRRRRKSGKMELGDEEERKSFRTKGIPVIFQDELDEKPEIGNKSPIILKDEKPPLLPPSYNTSNMNGDNDVDEYLPPPAVVVGGREGRGKSPATPSYRKPPPYVSP